MMLKILSGAAMLALTVAAPAFAADLAAKAPAFKAAAPVPFSWTGCFVGGHVGGAVSEDKTIGVAGNSTSFSASGFVGGGQIGCDYQFAPGWVVGVEGRAAWTDLKGGHPGTVRNLVTGVVLPSQFSTRNDFLASASATARLGYSVAERWLVFVRGGAAWTHEKSDDAFTNAGGIAVDPSSSTTRTGWTAGAGVEWAFAPHWSTSLEYDFYDFGTHGVTLTQNNTFVSGISVKDTIHAVTAAVDYHF
jgi:outer membrane immunogenic protein